MLALALIEAVCMGHLFGPSQKEQGFTVIPSSLVTMADSHVDLDARRFTGMPDEFLQIAFRDLAGVGRNHFGQALALGVSIGDEVLHHDKHYSAQEENLEVRPDKYRALHSPNSFQSPWS